MRDPRRYYRPELDVLRFFAFFLVFLSHVVPGDAAFYQQAHIPSTVAQAIIALGAGGAFGVDLFFALSAFLITTLLLREHGARGTIDVRAFYMRRILRIWPLYFVFLLIVVPLLQNVVPDESMPRRYTLAFALLAGNWACVFWGYPHSIAGPLWSVSIEEQFYVTWPLLLRPWARHVMTIAMALLVISFVVRAYLVAQGAVHPQIWCNTLSRLDPIACGALLAMYAERRELTLSPVMRVAMFLFGVALLALAGRYGDFTGAKALVTFPAVTLASIAMIAATLGIDIQVAHRPVMRGLRYLGRISYGLYVFHLMFVLGFGVGSAHEPMARLARMLAALLATIALAALSYQLLEKPFLRLKERFAHVRSRPA